ncbi:MAG TPA: TRAP transporter substrate-binding protein [Burkholderiales bacterium]|nr:TRAP transporter substrate-binding protein [Burkholderiales bacterium]
MKRQLIVLSAAAAAFFCAAAQAQTVLRFNTWLPLVHPIMAASVKPWTDDVAKATDHRVRFEFTAQSMGPPPNQFEMVRDGVVDAAITVHGYTPARFPLMQIGELPFVADTSEALSVALWRVTQKHFAAKDEHAGTQVMALFTSQPGRVFTTKRALRTLKDWEGLKFAGGAAINLQQAKALGGVGIRAPGPQASEMLKRGVVDGLFIDMSSFTDFHLAGTAKYMLDFPRGIHAATFMLVVNKAKWDAIAPADQAAIQKISGEALSRRFGRNWDAAAAKSRENLKPAGVEVTMADGAYFAELQNRLRFLEDEWLKQAAAAGVDGKAALADLRANVGKQ